MKKVILVLLALLCTGCAPAGSLDDMTVVRVASVDYADGGYTVTVTAVKPGGSAWEETPTAICLQSTGATVDEAMENLSTYSVKTPFWGYAAFFLVGEEAFPQMEEILASLVAHRDVRLDAELLAVEGNGGEVLRESVEKGLFLSEELEALEQRRKVSLATVLVQSARAGSAYLSNKKVPKDDRVIYLGWTSLGVLRTSNEFIGNDALGSAILKNGAIGSFMGAAVVPVPDEYLKKGTSVCYFLITHKNSVLQPKTIQDYFVKQNPPGINGSLLEGRFRYDAFVLETKCDGVYALVATGAVQATPSFSYSSATQMMTMSSAGAQKIIYTLDGTDPRYSHTALVMNGSTGMIELSDFAGTTVTIKAIAVKNTLFCSAVGVKEQAVAE